MDLESRVAQLEAELVATMHGVSQIALASATMASIIVNTLPAAKAEVQRELQRAMDALEPQSTNELTRRTLQAVLDRL